MVTEKGEKEGKEDRQRRNIYITGVSEKFKNTKQKIITLRHTILKGR